jgi:hypothetical protein
VEEFDVPEELMEARFGTISEASRRSYEGRGMEKSGKAWKGSLGGGRSD